jgi:hypothetical protein
MTSPFSSSVEPPERIGALLRRASKGKGRPCSQGRGAPFESARWCSFRRGEAPAGIRLKQSSNPVLDSGDVGCIEVGMR